MLRDRSIESPRRRSGCRPSPAIRFRPKHSLIVFALLWGTAFAKTSLDQHRYVDLLKELRCVVCQNQDLSDSHAPLAKQLRLEVQRLMSEGKTNDDIRGYLVERYGEFILFKPPLKASTALLWFGPLLFVLLGVGGLLFFVRRSNKSRLPPAGGG